MPFPVYMLQIFAYIHIYIYTRSPNSRALQNTNLFSHISSIIDNEILPATTAFVKIHVLVTCSPFSDHKDSSYRVCNHAHSNVGERQPFASVLSVVEQEIQVNTQDNHSSIKAILWKKANGKKCISLRLLLYSKFILSDII